MNEEKLINAIYADIAERIKNGASNVDIVAALIKKGMPHELVEPMVIDIRKEFVRIRRGQANKNVGLGALFGIVGLTQYPKTE